VGSQGAVVGSGDSSSKADERWLSWWRVCFLGSNAPAHKFLRYLVILVHFVHERSSGANSAIKTKSKSKERLFLVAVKFHRDRINARTSSNEVAHLRVGCVRERRIVFTSNVDFTLVSIVFTIQLLLGCAYVKWPRPRVVRVDQLDGEVVRGCEVSRIADAGVPGCSAVHGEAHCIMIVVEDRVIVGKEVSSQEDITLLLALGDSHCACEVIICHTHCVALWWDPVSFLINHDFHITQFVIKSRAFTVRAANAV